MCSTSFLCFVYLLLHFFVFSCKLLYVVSSSDIKNSILAQTVLVDFMLNWIDSFTA